MDTIIAGTRGGLALDRLVGPPANNIMCDGCMGTISRGQLRYSCLECHGWVPPQTTTRTTRLVELQQTRVVGVGNVTLSSQQTENRMGYDLCSSCARNSSAHADNGHHFALWVTR